MHPLRFLSHQLSFVIYMYDHIRTMFCCLTCTYINYIYSVGSTSMGYTNITIYRGSIYLWFMCIFVVYDYYDYMLYVPYGSESYNNECSTTLKAACDFNFSLCFTCPMQSRRRSTSLILWSLSAILASAILAFLSASSRRLIYTSSWAWVNTNVFQ